MNTLPIREHIPRRPEDPIFCEQISGTSYGTPWHFHPELELVLVQKSQGYRIVGDNITNLAPGDLVLVGSNLPHLWHQDATGGDIDATVVQFVPDFVGVAFADRADFEPVRQLMDKARRGLHIAGEVRDRVAARMKGMLEQGPLRRLAELIIIMDDLAHSPGVTFLSSPGFAPQLGMGDQARVDRVMQFIHKHLCEPINRDQVATVAALSPGAFSRFFHSRTGRTFPAYLNELRLGRAARLLSTTDQRVVDVASDCGFRNLAHFNRLFLKWKGVTPSEFRKRLGAS
ncbi:MAG: AraC family transcriptional regulator [Verrucomicrobium sp.]